MARALYKVVVLLLLVFGLATPAQAATYDVVDAGGAWPQDLIGTYTENGTHNGKPCYQGPNEYWLYFTQWGGYSYWFIGKPLGNSEINDISFYKYSPSQTLPLDTNFDNTGNTSGTVKVTISGGSPPPPPGLVSISSATASSFTSSWSDVSSATGYKLDVSTTSDFSSFVSGYGPYVLTIPEGTPLANRPTSHLVSGLSPGTDYYLRMRAFNGFGDSANSSTASVTTIPDKPTVQPATNVNEAGFKANWSSQPGATSYRLYVSTASNFSSHVIDGQFASTNYYTVTGLAPNTTYYYRVKAVNTSGESGLSGHAQITTGPVKPEIMAASDVQSDGFTANWQSSAGATGYYLDVATNSSFDHMVAGYANINVGNVTSYQVNQGINPYTTYYMRVRAYNTNGITTYSSTVSVTTLPVMAAVTTGTVSDIGQDSALASGSITNPGVPVAGQHGFCWNTTGSPTINHSKTENGAVTGAGVYSGLLTGLQPATQYYVRAYATNEAGTAYGAEQTFTTLEPNTAPAITDTEPSLDATDEDTLTDPVLISTFLHASDPDPGALTGIAVIGVTGNGTWQYSLDGATWSEVGAVSDNSALLLRSTDYIRYIPDGVNGETVTITYRAWDQTSGVSGTKVSTATNGGTTAFSANTGTATLTVVSVADPPLLDLNGAGEGDGSSAIFCAGGSAVNISPDATLSDVDLDDDIVSLTAVIESVPHSAGEYLALNAGATAAASALNVSYSADTRTLSITGTASPATYQTILRGIVYGNDSDPTAVIIGARTISVIVNDGELNSNTAYSTVTVVTAPVIDLNGSALGRDTSAAFTEGGGPVAVSPDATIVDPDGDDVNQLVINLTNPQDGAAESITISGCHNGDVINGITITYDAATRITLAGTATVADYQTLLHMLTYQNTSDNPDVTSRTITARARDVNGYNGNIATVTVSISAVNDAPILTVNTGLSLDEGASVTLTSTMLACSDPDNAAVQITYAVTSEPVNGRLLLDGNPLPGGTFTQADIDNTRVTYTHDGSETTSDSFTFTVTDGAGGSIGNTTFAITVNPVNDAPVIAVNQELTLDGGSTVTIGNDFLHVTDADNNPDQLTYTITTAPASGTLYKDGSAILAGGAFTQQDIGHGLITYTHDNSETTADGFAFMVDDGAGGTVSGTFNFHIEPTVINAGTSTMSVNQDTIPADGSTTAAITVLVKNINGKPLSGHVLTLDQGSGNSVISPASSITNAGGEAVFTVKNNRAETVTYAAYDETNDRYITQTVKVTFEPGIMVSPTSGDVIEGQSMQYQVALVSEPAADVVISMVYGAQLILDKDNLTFTQANYTVPQRITVTANDDDIAEGPHAATVSHSVYSSDPCYDAFIIPDVTVNITDNDTPGIAIMQSNGSTQVIEGGPGDSYEVTLTTRPAADVEISISGGSQLDINPANLIFTTGDWNVPQTVNVWAIDDGDLEWAHTGTVSHSVYSADPDYNNYNIPDIMVQITDNDASVNANLVGLTLSNGTLTPAFAPGITRYTANVSHSVASVTVTATPEDVSATIQVNGQRVSGGSQSNPIALKVGDNTITVLVTAQDNSTTEEYVITVRRSGGRDRDRDRNPTPSESGIIKNVDAKSGGTLSHRKVIVIIPPGTLPADATVSITALTTSQANDVVPAGLRVKMASDIYEIATSGARDFGDHTITIKIAYDPSKTLEGEYPAIHYYDETLGRWVKLKTEHVQENGTWYAVTRVNHLTKFVVFSLPEEEKQVITLTIGQIQASVNHSPYTLDAAPYVDQQAGRTLVPIRFVSEALGANVKWEAATQQVTILNGGRTIIITLNSNHVLVDGQSQQIDCAPVVLPPGRTFVPLRFVSETLGSQVDYNQQTKQVTISGINRW